MGLHSITIKSLCILLTCLICAIVLFPSVQNPDTAAIFLSKSPKFTIPGLLNTDYDDIYMRALYTGCEKPSLRIVSVIVRYTPSQHLKLPGLLLSLHSAANAASIFLHTLIVATDKDAHKAELARKQAGAVIIGLQKLGVISCAESEVLNNSTRLQNMYDGLKLKYEVEHYDSGYIWTDVAASHVFQRNFNQLGASSYIMFTNGDNIYAVHFFKSMKDHMERNTDVIAVSWYTHYDDYTLRHSPQFIVGQIDLGCFVVRLQILQTSGLQFSQFRFSHFGPKKNDLNKHLRLADGKLISALVERTVGITTITISSVHFFHQ